MSTDSQFTISLTFRGNGTVRVTVIKPDGMSTNLTLGAGIDDDLNEVMRLVKESLKSHREYDIY